MVVGGRMLWIVEISDRGYTGEDARGKGRGVATHIWGEDRGRRQWAEFFVAENKGIHIQNDYCLSQYEIVRASNVSWRAELRKCLLVFRQQRLYEVTLYLKGTY